MTGWAGLIDTFWPLILPIPSMLGVVLIRQAIVAIPREMFECARLDGCNDMRIFYEDCYSDYPADSDHCWDPLLFPEAGTVCFGR